MTPEKILNAITKSAHGTVAQIAEIAGIEPREAIMHLRQLEESGDVAHKNCLWYVVENAAIGEGRMLTIMEIIAKVGAVDVKKLRRMTRRTAQSITQELSELISCKLVTRQDGLYNIAPRPDFIRS